MTFIESTPEILPSPSDPHPPPKRSYVTKTSLLHARQLFPELAELLLTPVFASSDSSPVYEVVPFTPPARNG